MTLTINKAIHPAEEREKIREEERVWFANRDRCRCRPEAGPRALRRRLRRYLEHWLCLLCGKLVQ